MAYSFSVNNTPATGGVAMYLLISTLVAAGWVVKADSDGTTYAAAGGAVTSGGAGAGGLGNSKAWVRIQAPATNGGSVINQKREWTFQRGTVGNRDWRIKYSASANFSGGAPAILVTPSSTDEVLMVGGGSDAAPTFTSWFKADGSYRWHVAAGGAAEFYSFNAFSLTSGGVLLANGLFMDVLAANSYNALDVDPAVVYCSDVQGGGTEYGDQKVFGHLGGALTNVTDPALTRAWMGATSLAGAAIAGINSQKVCLVPYGSISGATAGGTVSLGVNPFSGNDDLLPSWWLRTPTSVPPRGLKGRSTLFNTGSVMRATLDTADTVAAKDKIFIAGAAGASLFCIWAPWSGAVPVP